MGRYHLCLRWPPLARTRERHLYNITLLSLSPFCRHSSGCRIIARGLTRVDFLWRIDQNHTFQRYGSHWNMTMKVVVVIFMGQRMYGVIHGHTTGHGQGPGYCKHVKMYCWMLDRQNVLPNVRPSNVLAIVRVSKILANVRVSHKLARERMSNITADVRMCKRKYAHVRIFWHMWAHSKALSNMNHRM